MIKSSGMTITPAVSTTMTSPTVPHHLLQQPKTSRVSNFSVASLLADTRPSQLSSVTLSPTTTLTASPINLKNSNFINNNSLINLHQTLTATSLANSILPTNLSQINSTSPMQRHIHHNNHHSNQLNDSNSTTSNSTTKNERHTPHSSVSAESDLEYDSNADDDDHSIVDIEDLRIENSMTPPTNDLNKSAREMLMATSAALNGHVPIRPTPFSALAAAAAAWNGINGSMPWPGARQMPFGPGMFPGQGFGGAHGGGG